MTTELCDIEIGDTVAAEGQKETKTTGEEKREGEMCSQVDGGRSGKKPWGKILLGLLVASFVIFLIIDSATSKYITGLFSKFLEWMSEHPAQGIIVFMIVALLILGSGYVFASTFSLGVGILVGTIVCFFAGSLGAIASFLLARYLLKEQVLRMKKKFALCEALDSVLEQNGLKIFLLLRVAPVLPFNVVNTIGGASSLSMKHYVVSLIGIIPSTILFCFLGASAESVLESASSGQDPTVMIAIGAAGLVFGGLSIFFVSRYAKKELDRVISERKCDVEKDEATQASSSSTEEEESDCGQSVV